MNRFKENKRNAYVLVNKCLELNQQKVTQLPMGSNLALKFKDVIGKIDDIRKEQELQLTEVAHDKRETRAMLEKKTMQVVVRLIAYAAHKNDTLLEDKIGFTMSDLRNAADTIIKDRCDAVYVKAKELLTELTGYGITQQVLDDLRKLIDQYYDLIPMPRQRIIERKKQKESLDLLFHEADNTLALLDKTIGMVRWDDDSLYSDYMNARTIIDLKGKQKGVAITTGIEGVVSDLETEQPLVGAEVKTGTGDVVVKTDEDGYYRIASKTGKIKLTISLTGYTPHEEILEVEEGFITENDVELEKPDLVAM